MARTEKTPKKPQNIRTWIRQRISPSCFGVKSKAGSPIHCNRNDDIAYHFQCLRSGWYGRRLSRLKNADMSDHFAGRKTYYFTADGRSATAEVLVNIDIDCHRSGSLAGAVAFAEHLKATKFPNLYYETSTNGNGVHGYLVIIKGGLGDEGLNAVLSKLDRWLKAELSEGNWDVENVEIKGHAPEFSWGTTKFELRSYKSGQLAKLPREALTRTEELRGTTRVTVSELRKLPVPAVESVDSFANRDAKRAGKKSAVSVSESGNWDSEASVVSEKVKKQTGSIAAHHFGPEELSKLDKDYLTLANELLAGKKLVVKGRMVVTNKDVAAFLMILKFFSQNMNVDGTLPVARWRAMWTALFGSGDIGRAWCHHRFAAMRNFFSDGGWLAWGDESFVVGVDTKDGRFVPGRASKWRAGEELMARLEAQEATIVLDVADSKVIEDKEEGESTLYGNTSLNIQVHQSITDDATSSASPETARSILPALEARQLTSFESFLDGFGVWIAIPKPRFAGYSIGCSRMAA